MDDALSEPRTLIRDYLNDSMMDEDELDPPTYVQSAESRELEQLKGFFAKVKSHARGRTKTQLSESKVHYRVYILIIHLRSTIKR